MSNDSGTPDSTQPPVKPTDLSTRWAADRTLWAADRTLIAWLRTAISMIGFGITLGKASDALETQGIILDSYNTLKVLGLAFISLAVLGLIGAVIQNVRIDRRLATSEFGRIEPTPLGLTMAGLVLVVGILGAIAIFL